MDRWVDGLKALEKNVHAFQKFSSPRRFCVPTCARLAETWVTKPHLPAKRAPPSGAVLKVLLLVLWGGKRNVFANISCWLGHTSLHCFCQLCRKTLEEALQPSAPAAGVTSSCISTPHPPDHGDMAAAAAKSQTLCDSLVCSPMITFETKHNRVPRALNQLTRPECVSLVTEIASLAERAPGSPAT